jgi:hypothetical protein
MKNAFLRVGQTCALGVLMAGAMLAGSIHPVTLTLPYAVTVGSTTLPSGQYTLSSIDLSDGNEYFMVRSGNGAVFTLPVVRIDSNEAEGKTQVKFQKEGNSWHFDKIFVADNGYQFIE